MSDDLDQVQALISKCLLKLRAAQAEGRQVEKRTLREAQRLLSTAVGTLTMHKELEAALAEHYSGNVIKFPGR